MLVLTRKANQSIVISDDIFVTVVSIASDSVQLSIDAPKHVPVHRQEVYEAIRQSRQARQPDGSPEATQE